MSADKPNQWGFASGFRWLQRNGEDFAAVLQGTGGPMSRADAEVLLRDLNARFDIEATRAGDIHHQLFCTNSARPGDVANLVIDRDKLLKTVKEQAVEKEALWERLQKAEESVKLWHKLAAELSSMATQFRMRMELLQKWIAGASMEWPRLTEMPCCHEWFQGDCVHCGRTAKEVRQAEKTA